MSEPSLVDISMKPLFDEAKRTGKWLWCRHQDLWFSPAELRTAQANGRFRWGAVNWQLRDPSEHIAELESKKSSIDGDIENFKARVAAE